MSSGDEASDAYKDDSPRSRFTYRHLRLLGQYSTTSPLRVIALVDFDCFYAQCEKVRLGLADDQPLGVQQFLHVIAINYPARAAGLKKVVTAVEAKQKCPNIVLQHVPTWREGDTTWAYRDDVHQHMDSDKSSLDYYRLQSRRAIEVIKNTLPPAHLQRIEKAGIDELFLDLSAHVHSILLERYPELHIVPDHSLDTYMPRPQTELLEWHGDKLFGTDEADEDQRVPDWDDIALNIGSEVVRNLRTEIHAELGYTCSAGIARNKVVAKLAAGHNKPNQQTIIRDSCAGSFLSSYKFTKMRGLGGKLGSKAVRTFSTDLVSEILPISLNKMQSELGSESGRWLYRVIRGVEHSEVVSRTQIKSMASAKTFTPSIEGMQQAESWLRIFAADIMGRMADQEGRRPRTIAVHHQKLGRFGPTRSKQGQIPWGSKLDMQLLYTLSRGLLLDITQEEPSWPCLTLSISVSDIVDMDTTSQALTSFWGVKVDGDSKTYQSEDKQSSISQQAVAKVKKRTLLDYQTKSHQHCELHQSHECQCKQDATHKKQRNMVSLVSSDMVKTTTSAELDETSIGQYRCPKCTKAIDAANVLEHLDWHVAMDLQDQA